MFAFALSGVFIFNGTNGTFGIVPAWVMCSSLGYKQTLFSGLVVSGVGGTARTSAGYRVPAVESFSRSNVSCMRFPPSIGPTKGFDTTFTFRLSSPSLRCKTMDGVYTHCRSRGADGVAFVVQGEGPTALGRGGMVSERLREWGWGGWA